MGQSPWPKIAPLLSRGRLTTGDEINQHKKTLPSVLEIPRREAGGKFRREVSFFSILIPNSTDISLILSSIDPCCFVLFQELCIVLKFRGISACIGFFKC